MWCVEAELNRRRRGAHCTVPSRVAAAGFRMPKFFGFNLAGLLEGTSESFGEEFWQRNKEPGGPAYLGELILLTNLF